MSIYITNLQTLECAFTIADLCLDLSVSLVTNLSVSLVTNLSCQSLAIDESVTCMIKHQPFTSVCIVQLNVYKYLLLSIQTKTLYIIYKRYVSGF